MKRYLAGFAVISLLWLSCGDDDSSTCETSDESCGSEESASGDSDESDGDESMNSNPTSGSEL